MKRRHTTGFLGCVALLFAMALVPARADVLLQGNQHIGDTYSHNGQVFSPTEGLSVSYYQAHPMHFGLSEDTVVTAISLSNTTIQDCEVFQGNGGNCRYGVSTILMNFNVDIYIDGNLVGNADVANGSNTLTLPSGVTLNAGIHTIYLEPPTIYSYYGYNYYFYDRNCTAGYCYFSDEADLGFSDLSLISAQSSTFMNFTRVYHAGDNDQNFGGTLYPTLTDGSPVKITFTPGQAGTLNTIYIFNARGISNGCAASTVSVDGSTAGNVTNGDLMIPDSTTLPNGINDVTLTSGDCGGGDIDDFGWDDIVLDISAATGASGFSIAVGTTNASTCSPLTVDVTALKNNGNVNQNYNKQIQISTSSGHGDWSLVSGNGVFDNGVADDGVAYYTFANGSGGDSGAVQFQLTNTHADDLTVSVVEVGKASTLSTSGAVAFRDNAFVVTDVDSLPGSDIAVAGRPHSYQIQMVDRDTNSGQCRVDPSYSGTIGLKAWLTRNAADPGGAAPSISGTALPSAQPGANNLNLGFSSGTATFTLATTDVGKYGINFRDDSSGFAQDTGGNPRPIVGGTSAELTVRPFGFRAGGAPVYSSPTSASSTIAGAPFSATITAVAWQAADDSNDDGVPDGHTDTNAGNDADLSDNAVTPSYAWSTALGAAQPIAPSGGTLGALSGTTTIATGGFTGGQATITDLRYTEVGAFTLSMNASNYLGTSGANVVSLSPQLGRFRPAQFVFTTLNNACTGATPAFTYSGQPSGSILVTAVNQSGGTTQNYAGSFAKAGTFSSTSSGVTVTANASLNASNFTSGQASLSSPNTPALGFASAETAPLDPANLTLTDSDGVAGTGNLRLLSGRLAVDSTVGSEQLPLQLPVRVEYYSGTTNGWTVNSDDSCTAATDLTPNLTSNAVGTSVSGKTLSNGSGNVTLGAPGAVGYADLELQGPDWLKFIWSPSGSPANPTARASFGLYKSDDHSIYVQ